MAEHLVEHINTNKNITIPILREIHEHIDDMDSQLSTLHKATEDASFIWRRLTRIMGMPAKGSFVPPTLIIPVAIDRYHRVFFFEFSRFLVFLFTLTIYYLNHLKYDNSYCFYQYWKQL